MHNPSMATLRSDKAAFVSNGYESWMKDSLLVQEAKLGAVTDEPS